MNIWIKWLKGLISAAVSSIGGSGALMLVAPEKFNFSDLPTMGKIAVALAIVGVLNYIKQSPFPGDPPKLN
jgi:ABC-type uncharacterized transport system permease subunit